MKKLFIYCLNWCFLCRRGNKHYDVHFRQIKPVHIPSTEGGDAAYQGKNEGKVFYSRQNRHFCFYGVTTKDQSTFPYLYVNLAR